MDMKELTDSKEPYTILENPMFWKEANTIPLKCNKYTDCHFYLKHFEQEKLLNEQNRIRRTCCVNEEGYNFCNKYEGDK